MLAEPLPVAWRVRVIEPRGVIRHERVFHLRLAPAAAEEALVHANLMEFKYPFCRVELAPLTPEAS